MNRIHIYVDDIGYFPNDTEDFTNFLPHEEISKDKGPVYITTFAISDLEDLKVLQDHLRVVFKELRKRFKRKKNGVE